MKYIHKTIIVFLLFSMAQVAFAGYYSYHFEDNADSPKMVDTYGGDIDLPLKMNLWLKKSGNIMVKVEKIDGTGLPKGYLYLQKNTNGDSPMDRIESIANVGGNDVDGDYMKSLTTVQTLDEIQDKWTDNKMFVYVRYENDDGGYAWVGPIVIIRKTTPDTGKVQVILVPNEISGDARWSFENEDGSWSDWFKSGAVLENMTVGSYRIRFNDFSNSWQPPVERYISIERNQLTSIKEIYQIQMGGGIQFLIEPEAAINAGAKCRAEYPPPVGFCEWLEDGETAHGFNPGSTKIECLGISGWDTPEPGEIIIPMDESAIVNITYCKTIPYTPTNVHATQGVYTDKVQITWAPISCVNLYDIYRSRDNVITFDERIAANFSDVVFDDIDADPAHDYYYSIVGINENGSGDFSKPVVGYKKLRSPENLAATDGLFSTKVRLTWNEVPGAEVYEIWRNAANDPDSADKIDENIETAVYDDSAVIPEKTYFYWVKAVNSFNTSDFSNEAQGSMDLAIPSGVKASECTFDDHVLISWNAVNGATGYHVKYILANARKRSSRYTTAKEPDTEYWHVGANPGQRYFYQVRAENPFGKSEYSAPRFGCQAMKAPRVFASKRTYDNRIHISWTKVDGATSYRLYRSVQNDFSTAEIVENSVIGLFKDDATVDTTHFYYWVEARNDYTTKLSESAAKGYISDGCEIQLSQTEIDMKPTGGTSEICITTETNCQWDAESLDNWLSITSQTSGMGDACISFQVEQSNTADPRKGAVRIAGQDVIVNQAGLNTFAVSISKKGTGSVKVNDEIVSLPYMGRFVLNENVTIEAIPGNEWQFDYFSGDVIKRENPMVISVNQDMSIMAEFSPVKYFVSVSREGSGIISINKEEIISGTFAKGERIVLQASPGNQFSGWTGHIESTENPLILTVEGDISITGKFDGWTLDILGEGANLGGLDKNQATIGVASRYVSVSAPPPPPSYSTFLTLKQKDDWGNALNHQIYRDGLEKYIWILAVNPKGNMGVKDEPASTLLTWDADLLKSLPEDAIIELRKGTDGTGEIVLEDMRDTNTFEVNGTNEEIYFSIVLEIDVLPPQCKLENHVQIDMQLEAENLGGAYKYNVAIGTSERSKMTAAAPIPPGFSCYMATTPPADNWQALAEYFLPCSPTRKEWILIINPVGNLSGPNATGTSELSWDLGDTGTAGILQLISGSEDEGEILVENMRDPGTNTYSITGDGEMYFRVVWLPSGLNECMNIDLVEGWNLVSLGVNPAVNDLTELFSDAEVAYGYSNGSYHNATNLLPNEGYWVKMPSAQTYQICGSPTHSYSVNLSQGWHLKGCTSSVENPGSNNDQIEVMYEYQQGAYIRINECTPGYGFWVRLKEADLFFVSDQY